MTFTVKDISDIVSDGKPKIRGPEDIKMLVVHRVGRILNSRGDVVADWGDDPVAICRKFTTDPQVMGVTGGEIPYTFIIPRKGPEIAQCLDLDDIGQHAKRWNVEGLGIGVVGDFRHEPMTVFQHTALLSLLWLLCGAWALNPLKAIRGHTELPGATSNSQKECPGKLLDMVTVRNTVRQYMVFGHRTDLKRLGVST